MINITKKNFANMLSLGKKNWPVQNHYLKIR